MCPFERQIKTHLPMDLKFWINRFISFLMPVRWANNRLSEFLVPNRNWYIQVTRTLIQHRVDLRLKVFITLFSGLICGYLVFPGYHIPPPNSDLLPGVYMITKARAITHSWPPSMSKRHYSAWVVSRIWFSMRPWSTEACHHIFLPKLTTVLPSRFFTWYKDACDPMPALF